MEFYFFVDLYDGCVRLLTQICLTLTTWVQFENTIPINQNKKGEIKERGTDWSDKWKRYYQCYKLFGRRRMAGALHYTEFQAIPPISMAQRSSFIRRMDAPTLRIRYQLCVVALHEVINLTRSASLARSVIHIQNATFVRRNSSKASAMCARV